MEKLHHIETSDNLAEILNKIELAKFIAYDIETTGVDKNCDIVGFSIAISPDEAYYFVTKYWDGEKIQSTEFFNSGSHVKVVESLVNKKLLMHNGIFDCSITHRVYGVSLIDSLHTDTLEMAHLCNEEWDLGLKSLGKRFFGESAIEEQKRMKESVIQNSGKWSDAQKGEKEMFKADKKLLSQYGAKDTILTYKVFLKLLPLLKKDGLLDFFYKEESMPLLRGPTYDMNTTGLKIDRERLVKTEQELIKEINDLEVKILREIEPHIKDKYPGKNKKTTFNIGSSEQRSWLLFVKLNNEFHTLTDGGRQVARTLIGKIPYDIGLKRKFIRAVQEEGYLNPKTNKRIYKPEKYIKCDVDTLERYAAKYSWVSDYILMSKKNKILKTYVRGIKNKLHYGVIYPRFNQAGTESGRYSSSDPNFQNLPSRDIELSKRVKEFIVARKGKKFVGADFSQVEPRIMAAYSQDEALLQCFQKNQDFYAVIGVPLYHVEASLYKGEEDSFENKYKTLRNNIKTLVLANNYGQTPRKLATKMVDEHGHHYTEERAHQIIKNYFELFPGVKNFILGTHEEVKENGYVKTMYGRIRRLPQAKFVKKYFDGVPHSQLDYQHRKPLNISINYKMQGTAASIINRAAIAINQEFRKQNLSAKLIMQVHDELIVECDDNEAETVSNIMKDKMENSISLPGVKLEAKPVIGSNLMELK